MGFHAVKLPHVPAVPYWCAILVLLLICSLLSSSQAKSACKCPSSDQDPSSMYTLSDTFDNLHGYLIPANSSSTFLSAGLGSYKKLPTSKLNLSEPGLLILDDQWIKLWGVSGDGTTIHEASFSVVFTMSIYQPNNQKTPAGEPLGGVDSTKANYSILIDYNSVGHNMTVQVSVVDREDEGKQSSGSKQLISFSNISSQFGFFSFSSSIGQLFQLHTLNSTVERLSDELETIPHKKKWTTTIILSSVLRSAAATVVTAAVVYCYFNSKYRGWKKELDQLAKTMQLLPGVPTQFNFSDIRRATNNFHETTKLGRGGFGAVYRCSLPGPKKGEALEVAVKKFNRDDNRRYEDFLAEVSVINRLRHKNIVPLVGWSYNKGEPLLIYEYMPNGSLDQHLFSGSGGLHYVHHEYEPRVLHRDIKANNIMIDSAFQGRLGDFGLACVVAEGKNSYTDIGAPGTVGFRAPEYVHSGKATTKSDIFAFGVLILEIVTGKVAVDAQFCHVTDWVWHLHREGSLLDAIDPLLTTEFHASDAKRLLLLGLACSNPNPSDRPTMVEAVQIITKLAPPPDVPLDKPRFVWPPEGLSLSSDYSTEPSSLGSSLTVGIEMTAENGGNSLHHRPITSMAGPSQELFSIYHTAE
ncbi:hypothetical protein C2845_PM07G00970 [Panicum miliaceum]|uniref:Protein kinase domain-containing protein n=1 Tax=Panicum miliaceum TaxID=4540 RepID=A0A3L6ST61_PANMI|nr:hypothetical protein C2845_PM07G00970 [Panicum miliaceum]